MNLTVLVSNGMVIAACECIKGHSFNLGGTRDKCAHFDLVTNLSPGGLIR